jgi:hypothetical protein
MAEEKKTKNNVISKVITDRRRLEQNLANLSPDEMVQPGVVGEWSVKDLLAHLAHWEELHMGWIEASRRGESIEVPGYDSTWKDLDPLNQMIYAKHSQESLESVLAYFRATHQAFMEQLEALTDEELFTPGFFAFTGQGRLEGWYGAFAAHDRWGKTELRQWMKQKGMDLR